MNFKDMIRLVISHFFMITVGVLFCTSAANLVYEDITYPAWYTWMIMLTGVVGALPTLLFYFKEEPTRKQFIVRVILHYIVIEILIMTLGYIFGWYSDFIGGLIIFGMILIVYGFVWFFSILTDINSARGINDALAKMNDEDE